MILPAKTRRGSLFADPDSEVAKRFFDAPVARVDQRISSGPGCTENSLVDRADRRVEEAFCHFAVRIGKQ